MRKFLFCAMLISHPCNAQDFISPLSWPVAFLDTRLPEPPSDLYKYEDADYSEPNDTSTQNSVKLSELTYSPSKSRTRANLQAVVNKVRAINPEQASQIEKLFASTDVIGQIGGAMKSYGLSKDNTADAFAVYWINAWQASVGDNSTPSAATLRAVAAQAARGLSQSPEFGQATDAQKQEMAEASMVQAALIDAYMQEAASDPAKLKAMSKAITQSAAASGLDLGKMTLTDNGFRER